MTNPAAPAPNIALRLATLRFGRIFLGGALGAVLASLTAFVASQVSSLPAFDITNPETVVQIAVVTGAGAGLNALAKYLREIGAVQNPPL